VSWVTAEGVVPSKIHRLRQVVYGDDCVDVSTVRSWSTDVKKMSMLGSLICVTDDDDVQQQPINFTDNELMN
jgi:hypothetical protein